VLSIDSTVAISCVSLEELGYPDEEKDEKHEDHDNSKNSREEEPKKNNSFIHA
jgi:hypothetical protein